MFTLSDKLRVLNTAADVRVYDPANAERVTSAAIAAGDRLYVEGFGSFDINNITNIKLRRALAPIQEDKDFTCVAPAGIAVGDAIEVVISINTSRYQAEVLAQNHIGNGRTFKFSTEALTGITAANIRTAIVAGMVTWKSLFAIGDPIVDVIAGTAAADIRVQGDAAGSISVTRVEIRRVAQGIATQTFVSLALNVTTGSAFEGQGQGKFLEETIQMATPCNIDPYDNDTADTRVDIRGNYTELLFEYATSYEENLGTTAADYAHTTGIGGPSTGGVAANHSFGIFCNESTMLAANSAIAKLAAIAVIRATAIAALSLTVVAAPLTANQDRDETLLFSDASSVATVAAFIA
jgi:hypothetical protein